MRDIASLLRFAEVALTDTGVPEARQEATSLLAAALERDRAFLIAHPEYEPEEGSRKRYLDFVTRRSHREPFHYITGKKEFFGLEFKVSPAVLIPRPETEILTEMSIELLRSVHAPRFCEVGIGSACVSVAILKNVPDASCVGLDISEDAIAMARENAETLGVTERLEIRRSDVLSGLAPDEKFDLIASNPPYVPIGDIDGLQPEVRDHEPFVALTGGEDGLAVVRRLIGGSPSHLKPGGTLMFEIGFSQAEKVLQMFDSHLWSSYAPENDLQGIPRCVTARLWNS